MLRCACRPQWNLIDVPDEDRPTITFKASPCFGNTWLFVTPVVGPPFPTNETARWASRKESEDNAISSQIYYGEYFISVYGVAASNFSIVAVIEDDPTTDIDPIPGNNGTVAALPKIDQEEILFEGDLMAMLIQFVTTDQSVRLFIAACSAAACVPPIPPRSSPTLQC